MKKAGFLASIALLSLTGGLIGAADTFDNGFTKPKGPRPIEGRHCSCNTCCCFDCQCSRKTLPARLCDDPSCWFAGLPVSRDHQHRPRCCTPRPPEIPSDDPCPTRPRPLPLPGPSNPWPWLDPRVLSNPGS